MSTGSLMEMDSLLREVMATLRKAYDLGRADALRDAVAMLGAEAATAGQEQAPAPPILRSRRRGPAARAQARGRPDTMTEERRAAAAQLLAEGRLSPRKIAMELGVSPSRLYRWLKERQEAE